MTAVEEILRKSILALFSVYVSNGHTYGNLEDDEFVQWVGSLSGLSREDFFNLLGGTPEKCSWRRKEM